MFKKDLGEQYSPLYFLSALGAGGLAITFFIYLMFMVEHPDTPMVTFNHILPRVIEGHPVVSPLVGVAIAGMLYFAILHFRLLLWNLREYRLYRQSDAYERLRGSNNEVTLMAIPLTLAMSINVSFVLGAVFVPDLWSVVEYLFPVAITGFTAIGVYGLTIFVRYLSRLIVTGDFDWVQNNSLGQMLAIFAFAMVGVGLSAPGAMSHHTQINALGIFLAIFFVSVAILLGILKFVLGFRSVLGQGINIQASPTLWIIIPILTLLGISFIRLRFGLDHGFGVPVSKPGLFILTSSVLSLQLLFAVLGYVVMRRLGYFRDYVRGDKQHVGSYALVCPGVALFVFGMFFITFGLVKNGLIEKFGVAYFLLLIPLILVQIKSIQTMFRLNRKLLRKSEQGLQSGEGLRAA